MLPRVLTLVLTILCALLLPTAALADTSGTLATVQADATRLDRLAEDVDTAVAVNDWPAARQQWRAFGETWLDVEDNFRDLSANRYAEIELAMVGVGDALRVAAPSPDAVRAALREVRAELAPFAAGAVSGDGAVRAAGQTGLRDLMATLDRAIAAAERGDAAEARGQIQSFQREWIPVEGLVKTRDPAVYRSTEDRMAETAAHLGGPAPRISEAGAIMREMRQNLAPVVETPARYGIVDAAIILFREGIEALLVVAALLAFLSKSGHADQRAWIWGGAGAGIAASVVAAFAIQMVFSSATAGASRELVEGITGLVAAAMLIYVSYWLHSRANLRAWQRYVHAQAAAALAGRGLVSLALISFLAVFREGAETVLFYMGIAPSIATSDLGIGIGLGAAALAAFGVVMLAFGLRIPLRPFFLVSSLLLYYLAFKFIGSGIHALQVAGAWPATPLALPSIDSIGIFPTWETTVPQVLLLAVTGAVLLWPRLRGQGADGRSGGPSAA